MTDVSAASRQHVSTEVTCTRMMLETPGGPALVAAVILRPDRAASAFSISDPISRGEALEMAALLRRIVDDLEQQAKR